MKSIGFFAAVAALAVTTVFAGGCPCNANRRAPVKPVVPAPTANVAKAAPVVQARKPAAAVAKVAPKATPVAPKATPAAPKAVTPAVQNRQQPPVKKPIKAPVPRRGVVPRV